MRLDTTGGEEASAARIVMFAQRSDVNRQFEEGVKLAGQNQTLEPLRPNSSIERKQPISIEPSGSAGGWVSSGWISPNI